MIRQLCYYYEYDSRKRMVVKQLPGADPVYMVYDLRDRLVLTQDGNLRKDKDGIMLNKWLFIKYDELNRPVMTGIKVYTGTHQAIQSAFTSFTGIMYESISGIDYTLNNSYPEAYAIVATDLLTSTYYDNYNFTGISGFSALSFQAITEYAQTNFTHVKGLATGTRIKVLNGNEYNASAIWLNSINYYDDKYRVIQTCRDLYDGSNGGKETVSMLYDFVGKVMRTKQSQTFNSTTTPLDKKMTYDHAGRLKKTEQSLNGGVSYSTLSEMAYNELGQLQQKILGGVQDVDYQYNICGWLTRINSPDNLGADLFAMRLRYNDAETGLNNTGQYNGNITGMVWNSTGKAKQGYAFAYDAINRLTVSDYKTNNGSAWTESTAYEEKGITYDKNGNIGTLQRSNSGGTISDNYTYSYTGNQLMNISSGSTYTYDKNGNMTFDGLRGLNLTYNILNLPATITRGTDNLSYIYSATGEKLAKLKNSVVQQYYTGNMVYNSSKALDYILHEEGMVKKATAYTYEYYLKDHLGNTRVVFSPGSGSTINTEQVDEYYPFGLSYRPISPQIPV